MIEDIRGTWESVAPAWEDHREFVFSITRGVTDRMIELLALRGDETVLELACGPGETGFEIATRLPGGTLIQSDFSAAMVEAARRGARARTLDNIEHRVLDAQAIDLPDASVDAIVCRYAFMLMPEQGEAFAECARVVRPGGGLVFAVWGPAERNMWTVSLALPLVQAGAMQLSDPTAPGGMFSLATPERIREAATAAGFADVTVEEHESRMEFDDFDAWYARQIRIAGRIAAVAESLTPKQRDAMREGTRALLEPMRDGDTYRLTALTMIARSVRPA